MKKSILTIFLGVLCTLFTYGQIANIRGINVMHQDAKTYQIINPANAADRGRIEIVFTYEEEDYPEAWDSPYLLPETGREYQDILDDEDTQITNIIEVVPPAGYEPCIRKEIIFYNATGSRVKRDVLKPNDPIVWDRTIAKYFTIQFVNKPIEKESFYYWFKGGGWDGTVAQTSAPGLITSIRVGEYYWMENNFNIWDPFTINPTHVYQNYARFSDAIMTDYFKAIKANNPSQWKNLYNVTFADIDKDYGFYFEDWGMYRSYLWGRFSYDIEGKETLHRSKSGKTIQDEYRLPYYEDVRQLFAMSPFCDPVDVAGTHTNLNERDIRYTIGANNGWNNCAKNFWEDHTTSTYWFDANNTYKLGYMPAGWRSQIDYDWFYNGIPNPETADNRWNLRLGGIAQMFYALYIPVGSKEYQGLQESIVTLAEHVNSIPDPGYRNHAKRMPFRWMRPMTDEELGYKLYINIDGIDKNSNEWKALANSKDEIPLLKAFRSGTFNINNVTVDIKKVKHTKEAPAAAPTNYSELPKGYLRGFYVQYKIENKKTVSANELLKYAYSVEDEVLGYKADWQQKSTRSTELPIEDMANTTVEVYPNPVSDILYINSTSDLKSIKVLDATGRVCINVNNLNSGSIDVSLLPKGLYIIRLESNNNVRNYKVLKK